MLRPLAVILASLSFTSPAFADSSANSAAVSEESVEAAGALVELGVRVTSGVVAVPLAAGGTASLAAGGSVEAAGASMGAVGGEFSEAAVESAAFAQEPLTVGDDVIVAQPAPEVSYEAAPAVDDQR